MGFVTVTARHDATAELGRDTQPGSGSFFVLRSTASRRGSTSVDEADADARVIASAPRSRDRPMRGDACGAECGRGRDGDARPWVSSRRRGEARRTGSVTTGGGE